MKKFYFTAITLLFLVVAHAQIVNIADGNFKAKLLLANSTVGIASTQIPIYNSVFDRWEVSTYNKIDVNNDGEIQVSEAQAIKWLSVTYSNISDLTGIEAFTNLQHLFCYYNGIVNLDVSGLVNLISIDASLNQLVSVGLTGLDNLQYLNLSENQFTNLSLDALTNLRSLNCHSNQLSTLNLSTFINLKTLQLSRNQFQNLNFSGLINLEELCIDDNQFSNVDISSLTNLKKFQCSQNQLTNLNLNGLLNLETLLCDYNQIFNLNLLNNTNLKYLFCSNNLLQTLNLSGLNNLESVECHDNQLTSLSLNGLTNMTKVYCSNNFLTALTINHLTTLTTLLCDNNLLQNLNVSGLVNLISLYCDFNQLTSINMSGLNNLQSFGCSNNQINTLDVNGLDQLDFLVCSNNLLTTLNIKNNNSSYPYLNFSNNPNLIYICAADDDLTLVQDLINTYGYINCHVNSYCSFNPGGTFYTIQGNSPIDFNNNGCDAADPKYPNLKYNISDGTNSGSLIANNSGNYNIPVQAGTHLMIPQFENPSYFNVSPGNVSVTFPATASPFIQDFCITPNGVHHDLEVVIIPIDIARPGFDATYKIKYKNKGNQPENATLNFNYDDAILDFVSSSTVPTAQATGNLSWAIGTLLPFASGEITATFNLNSPMETPPVNSGNILSYTANCNGLNIDDTIADNTFNLSQTVVNSYDPNDKNCLEGNTINPAIIGEYVHYMIRFENTGTFAAQNVVVKDIIDTTKFEIATLQMTEASHSCVTKISDLNKVEFIFENINLPFDNATNDGFVVFKIKTKANLVVGNTISNSANIYFDYNFPIVTNTATSTFQTPLQNDTFMFENYFSIYPNPANDVLNITSKLASEIYSLSVYNVLGQLVQTITRPTKTVDVSGLKTGNYILKVNTENGISSNKFTKF